MDYASEAHGGGLFLCLCVIPLYRHMFGLHVGLFKHIPVVLCSSVDCLCFVCPSAYWCGLFLCSGTAATARCGLFICSSTAWCGTAVTAWCGLFLCSDGLSVECSVILCGLFLCSGTIPLYRHILRHNGCLWTGMAKMK